MATYQITAYSTDVYGSRPLIELDASPVTAVATGPGVMLITWAMPGGDWTRLRLVKSAAGYPVNPDDGETLYDSIYPDGSYSDTALAPGRWYYYSVFLLMDGDWLLAGQASGLCVGDTGGAQWIQDLVPNHFKYTGDELSSLTSSRPNDVLTKFLGVFGWGLDNQRTFAARMLETYDVQRTHADHLTGLSEQLALPIQRTMPARLQRMAVANATYLHQRHGTVDGLRALINTITGLDADIRISQNMMLSDDQAEFAHPTAEPWNAELRYVAGDKVSFSNRIFTCLTTAAGDAQKPNSAGTTNTWWTWTQREWDATTAKNARTDGQYTWMAVDMSNQHMVNNGYLGLGRGLPSVGALTDYTNTALGVRNNSGGTKNFDLRSVSRLVGSETVNNVDQIQNVRDGIPLPKVSKTWTTTELFRPGDLVRYNGLVFQAQFEVIGGSPPGITDPDHPTAWRNVGVDDRYGITVSVYTHQSFLSGDPTCAAFPHVGFFGENGEYFTTLYAQGTETLAIDTFGFPGKVYPNPADSDINGRQMERFEAYTWTTHTGAWVRDPFLGGVARPTVAGTTSIATVVGPANMNVALTPRTEPAAGKKWALIFRYANATNYWSAEKNGLYKVVAGVKTNVGFYSSVVQNNDRIRVNFNGSSIIVYRNGTQVLSVTDAFNASATRHGIGNV